MIIINDKYGIKRHGHNQLALVRRYRSCDKPISYCREAGPLLKRVPETLSDSELIRISRECDALLTVDRPKISKTERLLRHYKQGGTITSLEAARLFGITQLAARHCELKKRGHDIRWKSVMIDNEYGEKVKVKSYWLAKRKAA